MKTNSQYFPLFLQRILDQRHHTIVRASWLSILGNFLLSILKISAGIISGSLAVIADGIDSVSDIATSMITLFTARFLNKPPNINFPYGYEKADTVATKALSFFIFFAGAQLGISTVSGFFSGETRELPGILAIYVTIISILFKLILSVYLQKSGKKVNSEMLVANGKNMQNDVFISTSVLLGLSFSFIFNIPLADRITACLVSIWIMKVGMTMFFKSNIELMDGMKDPVFYCELFNVVKNIKGAHNPHRVRVRKIGSFHMVSLDVEVEPQMSVQDAHEIARDIEKAIKENLPKIFDVIVHIEPLGNKESGERFGLREVDLKDFNE